MNERIADDLESEHGSNPMTDKLRELIKSFPARQELWIKTANSWKVLKNTSLSDEVIEAWERNNPPRID
ncbi:MAG TPA: hypothetical protein VK476_02890 [Flavobacterium sp.]|nr:hypothetical protein [Flavobacterium sp.]